LVSLINSPSLCLGNPCHPCYITNTFLLSMLINNKYCHSYLHKLTLSSLPYKNMLPLQLLLYMIHHLNKLDCHMVKLKIYVKVTSVLAFVSNRVLTQISVHTWMFFFHISIQFELFFIYFKSIKLLIFNKNLWTNNKLWSIQCFCFCPLILSSSRRIQMFISSMKIYIIHFLVQYKFYTISTVW
jgi:hypothetical protein